jgi:hypothetical protein
LEIPPFLDSFGEIAFGQSFGCLKDPEREVEFAAAFDRLNHALSYRIISPIWKLKDWWTGNGKVVEQDTKTVHEFAYNVIRKRRAALAEGKQQFKDLMQLFIDARDEHDQPLSDEMLKDELINMVLGKSSITPKQGQDNQLGGRMSRRQWITKRCASLRFVLFLCSGSRHNGSGTFLDVLPDASSRCQF